MMNECPKCGSVLKKIEVFNEEVIQCTQCEYKAPVLDEIRPNDENILEEVTD